MLRQILRGVRRSLRWIWPVILLASAACSPASPPQNQPPFQPQQNPGLAPHAEHAHPAEEFQILLANSQFVIGPNRVAFGLIEDGEPLQNADVSVRFYVLNTGQPVLMAETEAVFYGESLGEAGIYAARTEFDRAGPWGVEAVVRQPGEDERMARIGFQVLSEDPTPAIGEPAVLSEHKTLQETGGERREICSAQEDDSSLHEISIAEAVRSGKPSVILFATPAFCTTRTCGPSLEVVKTLQSRYHDRANFIHIEIYNDFQTFELAEPVVEWRLKTEPWLFFVSEKGTILEKIEGGITLAEVEPIFDKLIIGDRTGYRSILQ